MKDELANELVNTLMPYASCSTQDLKMMITIAMQKYDVRIAETALTVWEGDQNEIVLQRFLAAKLSQGCSPRTIDYYKKSVSKSLAEIGKPYNEITADDIRYYLAVRIQRNGVTKATANNERRNLSAFYGWLQKEEILLKNPMSKIEAIKETKKKKKAYSLLDLEKIRLGCTTTREKAIVEFLASTWCRISEMIEVKIADIENGKVTVHGKGDKYREVFLNARAMMAVELYLADRKDSNPYLFPKARYTVNEKGHRHTNHKDMKEWYKDPDMVDGSDQMDKGTAEAIVRKIGRAVGVNNVHPHRFRRTGATMALRQGMPLTTVSKLLGHESIETTQIYLDISDEELEQAHRKYVV